MRTKHCPTCACAPVAPVTVNIDAPFYSLVLLIEQVTAERRIARAARR